MTKKSRALARFFLPCQFVLKITQRDTQSNAGAGSATHKVVEGKHVLPAILQDGKLTLTSGKTNIPALYHPSDRLIVLNRVSEFHRVDTEPDVSLSGAFIETKQ